MRFEIHLFKFINSKQLRIIWAPHHRIFKTDQYHSATIIEYAELFMELAKSSEKYISWVFKPHPWLKMKLYKHPDWGKMKTDEYYKFWGDGVNTSLNEDEYVDLFIESDALIHDCQSFIAEYVFTKKPMLYLVKNESLDMMNDFGMSCLDCNYLAYNDIDIKCFINNLVQSEDVKAQDRVEFINQYFKELGGDNHPVSALTKIKKQLKVI